MAVVVVAVAAAAAVVALQHGVVVGHGELLADPRHLLHEVAEPGGRSVGKRKREGRIRAG